MSDGIITTDSSKCRQCYSCVRNCPVKAVKIKDGKAQIIQSRCIQCGNCIKYCSRGAKIVRDGALSTKRLLSGKKKVIALIAPSFAVSFYPISESEVISQLQSLGFHEVWETAIGAEYVIDYAAAYINMHEDKPMLSSACLAFVNLVERHYPHLIDYLIPVCSPMVATGRIIREKYKNEEIAIVFMGPCAAKKDEIVQAQFEGCIDEVITFPELKQLIDNGKNEKDKSDDKKVPDREPIKYYRASAKGRSIPLSGGLMAHLDQDYPHDRLLNCDGIQNCMELVQYFNNHEQSFYDLKMCDTLMCRGCIDGAFIDNDGSIFDKRKMLLDFIQQKENAPLGIAYTDQLKVDLTRHFSESRSPIAEPDEASIKRILAGIDKLEPEDELNCGACGYDSCKEKAIAVYQGIAEVEMCMPYLLAKKNELFDALSQRFLTINELNEQLNGIFESSYDGLMVCDVLGNIKKVNAAWKKMFDMEDKEIPCNISELEKQGVIYPSAAMLAAREKRRLTFLQEGKNGKKFIATGNPIIDGNGEITGVVTNIRDIEELNRLRYNYHNDNQKTGSHFAGIIANSIEFGEVIELASQAAKYKSTVLLLGETGVGKDVVARFIHHLSSVKNGPFIKVNCGAIPENLIESELFGYASGAFTGAKREGKKGFFELADGGTIFLDEIGDLPLSMQVKLLQVIQDKKVNRIGAGTSKAVNVRIVAATNKNLQQMVKEGEFRSDLYYRLNVVPIYIPPLRERKDDIIPLAYHFLKVFNRQYECNKEFSPDVPSVLRKYYWPGNVRELQNIIERVVVTSKQSMVMCKDFPPYICARNGCQSGTIVVNDIVPLREAIDEVEKQIIHQAYKAYGNTYKVAEILGVNQSTVVRKLKKLGKHS